MSALIHNNEVHIMSFLSLLKNVAFLNIHSENFCKLKYCILHTLVKVENLIKCKLNLEIRLCVQYGLGQVLRFCHIMCGNKQIHIYTDNLLSLESC